MDMKICSKNNLKVIKRCSLVVVQLRTSNQDFVYNCMLLTSDPYTLLPLVVCVPFSATAVGSREESAACFYDL